jgi:prolyl-tRNA synthetase
VLADTGNIGGSTSHEFHVLADSGEDEIIFSSKGDYAANRELAEGKIPDPDAEDTAELEMETVETGAAKTIEELCSLLTIEARQTIKTLFVHAADADGHRSEELVALVLRGDQDLNETKAQKLDGIASPLEFASDEAIQKALGCPPGCLGPVELSQRVIADHSALACKNFVCGANREGQHLRNANWQRDCQYSEVADIRKVNEGDISPDGEGRLAIKRGIEVGHIFQLGKKYSQALNASVLDENGKSVVMSMGCYGIGVTRVVAACIEQNHDDRGIIWPENIAPFNLMIIMLDAQKSEQVREFAEDIYQQSLDRGLEVLLDDRDKKTSPGVKFAESELLGIPHRLVISPRGLADGIVEYTNRRSGEKQMINRDELPAFLAEHVNPVS